MPEILECDHFGTSEAVCPYCGYEVGDSWALYDQGTTSGNYECDECGKEFFWEVEFDPVFSTTKIDQKEGSN
jgi:DNA-directed RNA polymerase subunit RPC12/RpoP